MSRQESRILWCLVEDDPMPMLYCVSDIPIGAYVRQLKTHLTQSIECLNNINSHHLNLFKLNKIVPIDPDDSLAQRLEELGGIDACSRKLSSGESVRSLFPDPHSEDNLHIVVQCSVKRPRLTNPTSNGPESESVALQNSQENWREFFNQLWGKGLEHFQAQYVRSQTGDSGASFRIMDVHRAFNLRVRGLLVRDEWDITWDCAKNECASGTSNFIIIGQTGIGKTLCLYYFLARRLALSLTTFFQDDPENVWLFNESGVHALNSKMPWVEIRGLSKDHTAWALVDSNQSVQYPAPVLMAKESPFFIVEAASPRENRLGWVKYHGITRCFYANPFSLKEILQGSSVQPQASNKDDLRNFFMNYGPSARECYNAACSENGLSKYIGKLRQAVARMSWDEIYHVVTEADFIAKFNDDTSYLVVLVRPADDERLNCHASIITRSTLRLLWKAHRVQLKRKSRELFHLFSGNRETTVSAGWLFEAIVHDMLEEGIDVPIDPMVVEQNNRANAVNDKHVASDIGTKRWQSSRMEYVPFTQNDRALVIRPLHYFVSADPSHPSYDSFTYELVPCASYEGPILNPKDNEVYDKAILDENSKIGLFTVFQVTIAAEHDLNEKGLDYICVIADLNKLNAIGIRYIGIIPAGQSRSFKVPVAWRGKLITYSLPIALQS